MPEYLPPEEPPQVTDHAQEAADILERVREYPKHESSRVARASVHATIALTHAIRGWNDDLVQVREASHEPTPSSVGAHRMYRGLCLDCGWRESDDSCPCPRPPQSLSTIGHAAHKRIAEVADYCLEGAGIRDQVIAWAGSLSRAVVDCKPLRAQQLIDESRRRST